jgi:hypothetical protein
MKQPLNEETPFSLQVVTDPENVVSRHPLYGPARLAQYLIKIATAKYPDVPDLLSNEMSRGGKMSIAVDRVTHKMGERARLLCAARLSVAGSTMVLAANNRKVFSSGSVSFERTAPEGLYHVVGATFIRPDIDLPEVYAQIHQDLPSYSQVLNGQRIPGADPALSALYNSAVFLDNCQARFVEIQPDTNILVRVASP